MINLDHIYNLMLIHKQRKDYKEDKDDWYVRDLLADLKHFCDEHGIDFNYELERAERFYSEEKGLQHEQRGSKKSHSIS